MPGSVTEACGVLAIDFRHCDTRETQLAYENLAIRLCTSEACHSVLLMTGGEDAEVHHALLASVRAVVQIAGARMRLHVAFVGASAALEQVCSAMKDKLRPLGCDVQRFCTVSTAARWLLAHEAALAGRPMSLAHELCMALPAAATMVFHEARNGIAPVAFPPDPGEALNIAAGALSRLVTIYKCAAAFGAHTPVAPDVLFKATFIDGASGFRHDKAPGSTITSLCVRRNDLACALLLIRWASLPFAMALGINVENHLSN